MVVPGIGASLMMRKTPALTMVEECRSAEVGVGATIAPRSQPEKGIIADFVNPQKTRSAAISSTGSRPRAQIHQERQLDRVVVFPRRTIANAKASPPKRFIQSALQELWIASFVCE